MVVHIFQKDKYEFTVGIFTRPFIVSRILLSSNYFTKCIREDYETIHFDRSVSKYVYMLKNVENFLIGA